MKKLIASLLLVVLATIVSLGWSISEFANNSSPETNVSSVTEQLDALRLLGVRLSRSLDNEEITNIAFIGNWNQNNAEQLSLIPRSEFVLPPQLSAQFEIETSLLLDSDEGISLHYLMPDTAQVLNIKTSLAIGEEENQSINSLYTMIFYSGVVVIMLVWISPLIRQLLNLGKTAKAFGMGELAQRIPVHKTSYIGEIETEFNRMADRIQQLLDDNKLLSRAVSHDLKTPIARLRFGIEALEETTSEKLRVKYFQRLNNDIDTMEELVMTLLSYARLDQANIKPELESIELNHWLALNFSERTLDHHSFSFIAFPEPLVVSVDPKYLSMQVSNLLSNAERFGQSQIQMQLTVEGENIWIHIDDDGLGISESEVKQVIQPFVRGQQSRGNAGHGMGLAIVNRIGFWMGSRLTIGRSPELGGARMSLRFNPLSQREM